MDNAFASLLGFNAPLPVYVPHITHTRSEKRCKHPNFQPSATPVPRCCRSDGALPPLLPKHGCLIHRPAGKGSSKTCTFTQPRHTGSPASAPHLKSFSEQSVSHIKSPQGHRSRKRRSFICLHVSNLSGSTVEVRRGGGGGYKFCMLTPTPQLKM